MGNLPRATFLERTDSLSSISHQLSRAQLGVGPMILSSLHVEMLTSLALCRQLELLWVHECMALPCPDVALPCSSPTSGFCDHLPTFEDVSEPCGEVWCIDPPLGWVPRHLLSSEHWPLACLCCNIYWPWHLSHLSHLSLHPVLYPGNPRQPWGQGAGLTCPVRQTGFPLESTESMPGFVSLCHARLVSAWVSRLWNTLDCLKKLRS